METKINIILMVADQDYEDLGPVRVKIIVLEPFKNILSHLLNLIQTFLAHKTESNHRVDALALILGLHLPRLSIVPCTTHD